tara:strand:+ start:9732 stop:10538 length:807 start_codon:yes stop_codon:yes gene_type:complete
MFNNYHSGNFDDNLENINGNDLDDNLSKKMNNADYTETFEDFEKGDNLDEFENNFENDTKLEVLNNEFTETVNFNETNNLTNFITPEKSFEKYNVIPNDGLKSNLINKPYNIVLYKEITGTHTFTLNETLTNIVSIKLLSAYGSSKNDTSWGGKFFAILHINDLQKNISAYDSNDPTDNDNSLNKLNDSFAVLENYDNYQTSSGAGRNWYKNEFIHNHDIVYFDPPKPQLKNLSLTIYDTPFTNNPSVNAFQLRLNLLIETTEKLRVY